MSTAIILCRWPFKLYLSKVTLLTRPGEISTRLDEDIGLVGREYKQICRSLIFTVSFADHSCSLLDISFYLRIDDPDDDKRSRRKAIGEGFDARSTSGLVQRACSVYGRVHTYLPPLSGYLANVSCE